MTRKRRNVSACFVALLLLVLMALGQGTARATINLIIDTDIATDIDDAGSLAIAHHAADLGDCSLLAMTVTSTVPDSVGATDAINYWYGRNIAIGQNKGTAQSTTSLYTGALWCGFKNRYDGYTPTIADATTVLRQALHNAADASVVICSIGGLTNLNNLLNSAGDGIDARTGSVLIAAKVVKMVCMGGRYPTSATPEFNFVLDKTAANNVAANWPTRIDFLGFEVGDTILTGDTVSILTDRYNPIAQGYRNWFTAQGGTSRASYDPAAVWYAIYGTGTNFSLTQGTNVVNSSTGANTFTNGTGGTDKHYYVVKVASDATLKALLNPYIAATAANPPTPTATALTSISRVMYLPFDENTGTTATDATGNAHNATLTNSAGWGTGQFGAALDPSPTSTSYATVPDATTMRFTSSQEFTASCWVRTPSSIPAAFQTIWAKSRRTAPWYGLYISSAGALQSGSSENNTNFYPLNAPQILAANTWYHCVVTQSNGRRMIWVNGIGSGLCLQARDGNGALPMEFGAWTAPTVSEHSNCRTDDFQLFAAGMLYSDIARLSAVGIYSSLFRRSFGGSRPGSRSAN